MRVELHPEARAEIRSAAIWYDDRREGLGEEFIAEVAGVLERISLGADSFPRWPRFLAPVQPIRRAPLRRFPYVIAFQTLDRSLLVLAVAHAKRRPFYWLRRANSRTIT